MLDERDQHEDEPPPGYDEPPPEYYDDAALEAWLAEQEEVEPPSEYYGSQLDDAALEAWLAEQEERAISSYKTIGIRRPTLEVDEIIDTIHHKIRTVNENIEERINEIKRSIEYHFDDETWTSLDEVMSSHEFISAYSVSQSYLAHRRLYVRHDVIHALSVTRYALGLVNLLFQEPTTREMFSFNNDFEKAKLVVALASLWHDCGNAMNREGHQRLSASIARPYIESQLKQLYPLDFGEMLFESLRAIEYHTEDSGCCESMESVVIRLADGLDCTALRCGESGQQSFQDLFNKGQLTHIMGKAGIDAVEMHRDSSRGVVQLIFTIDPEFIPRAGVRASVSMHEIERLNRGKIQSLGSNYSSLFELSYRVSTSNEVIRIA